MKGLAELFADLNKLLKYFQNMDPNTKTISLADRNIHNALSAYQKTYDEE
jgi:hypothetical protein